MTTISSPGLGSGLDVNSIVTQLMAVEQQPITDLTTKEAGYQSKISAYGTLQGSLSSFQSSLSGLSSANAFKKYIAASSDSTVLNASASSTASAGSYAVNVTQLAQAQSLYGTGQADINATIGSGAATTVTFDFGTIAGGTLTNGTYTGASFTPNSNITSGTISITSGNNTLGGIRDAINNGNFGVSASIVNDGSGAPNRLVLTSTKTGAAASLKITVTGDATLNALLGNDPAGVQHQVQSQVAQDALLTVNGLAVTSTTNAVTSTLQGITLNLFKTGASNVSTTYDQASVQKAVQAFVVAYNDTAKSLSSLTSYNATTKQGGLLLGDSTVQRIQTSLRSTLTNALPGGAYTTLSQIGVAFQRDGTLTLDTAKLQTALNSNPFDVAALFATSGKTSDPLIGYVGAATNTTPGTYAINVSNLVTHPTATGSILVPATTNITAANNALNVTLNGVSASVTLANGTYTPAQLAVQIQSAVNASSAVTTAKLGVTVSVNGAGKLVAQSNSTGAGSNISLSGVAATALFGLPTYVAGSDLAGTIGGTATTTSGQVLTGGGAILGLQVQVNGGATGARGTVTLSQGYSDKLNKLLDGLLNSSGLINSRTDGLQRSIKDIDSKRDQLNTQLAATEKRYRAQFSALDTTISSLKNTSNYLTQQLANLNGSNLNSNK